MEEPSFLTDFSEDTHQLDDSFKQLDKKLNQLQSNPIFNVERAEKLAEEAKDLQKTAEKTSKDGFESAVLTNIANRAHAVHQFLKVRTTGNYNYQTILRDVYGVTEKDIKNIEQEVKSTGIQDLSNKFSDPEFNVKNTKPKSSRELKTSEKFLKKACETIFKESPEHLKQEFTGVEDYMDTVEFSQSRNKSYHETGRVVLSVKNAPVAKVRDNKDVERHVNVVRGMKTVGEETLLGHQGQHLLTNQYDLPYSLRTSKRHTSLASEIRGKFGRSQATSLLKENKQSFKEFIPGDVFDFLHSNEEDREKAKYLNDKFLKLMSDYHYIVEDKDIQEIQSYLKGLTGWNYYESRLFEKNLEHRYTTEFWDSYWSNLKTWIYITAYIRHKEIKEELEQAESSTEEKIRSYMKIGEWTREGFDEYLNFLQEYTSQSHK